jgi:hypothetical protein
MTASTPPNERDGLTAAKRLPPSSSVPHVYRRGTGAFELALVLALAAVVFGIFAWKGLL